MAVIVAIIYEGSLHERSLCATRRNLRQWPDVWQERAVARTRRVAPTTIASGNGHPGGAQVVTGFFSLPSGTLALPVFREVIHKTENGFTHAFH